MPAITTSRCHWLTRNQSLRYEGGHRGPEPLSRAKYRIAPECASILEAYVTRCFFNKSLFRHNPHSLRGLCPRTVLGADDWQRLDEEKADKQQQRYQ